MSKLKSSNYSKEHHFKDIEKEALKLFAKELDKLTNSKINDSSQKINTLLEKSLEENVKRLTNSLFENKATNPYDSLGLTANQLLKRLFERF